MSRGIETTQTRSGDVGVDLRRPEALVTEQFLYDAKVRAPI
jgi:hypothetical protein